MTVYNVGCKCNRKCDCNAALSKLYTAPKENMLASADVDRISNVMCKARNNSTLCS